LVATVGARTDDERLLFRVASDDRDFIDGLLVLCGVNPARRWIVLHPGASAASRRYPPEQFAVVIESLVTKHGIQVVLTGNDQERELVARVRDLAGVPIVSLAGRLQLGQLAALLQAAPLLISNNSGPVHLAAAVGTSIVDLYALTNPQHTPWQVPSRVLSHDVPCRNCFRSVCPEKHQHCLTLIEPRQVVAAALELLAERGAIDIHADGPMRLDLSRRKTACIP
jgi:ADP-heptose:LPS heptosyltransferase